MLPTVIGSVMAASVYGTRDLVREMSQPDHRVAADFTIAVRNISPVDVLFRPEKIARSALICAIRQHDFVAFPQCRNTNSRTHHIPVPPSSAFLFVPRKSGAKFRLVHKPRLFRFDFRGLFFTRYASSISLRCFLIVELL